MLIALTAILFILIFIVCGDKGTKSIISTVMNAVLLLLAIFLIYRNFSPMLVTIGCCVMITVVTLFYQNEVNIKSKVAFLSVLVVIVIVIPLIYFMASCANAAGFNPEEYEITDSNVYTRNIDISMLALQISIMLIALMGTVIDTAVAITSSIYEIRANNKDLPLHDLMKSSFKVSKAVLSTSIHTIFYIYIAEYMTLLIQYMTDYSLSYIINSQSFARELISVSISGIGCCLVVPVATVAGAVLISREGKSNITGKRKGKRKVTGKIKP
ncbi:MAG: YibE/F family protein [Clostridiales bacterium]|nr:YibE/F family protein [Clostridiales bacterium]